MVKNTKRKKEKVADFKKPKLKLGKGKKPATNAVDTTFKARSIALPQQSISVDKNDSTPTTRRRLTFEDLLSHLKHHNPGIKRDAFQGLRELLDEHPELVDANLLIVINACVRLMSEEDSSVRKALLTFFNWLLPRVPSDAIAPHAQFLLLYTTSAQTNIFAEIRIDAVRFLDLLLDVIPSHVVAGCLGPSTGFGNHGRKVLDGYLSLLSSGARFSEDGPAQPSTSSTVMLSSASKAVILSSLSRFLRHAILDGSSNNPDTFTSADPSVPLWYLASSFANRDSYESYSKLLRLNRCNPTPSAERIVWGSESDNNLDFVGNFTHAQKANFVEPLPDLELLITQISQLTNAASTDEGTSSTQRLIGTLGRTLQPILVSTFLDCAPAVFSPSEPSPEAELGLIVSTAEIARCIYGKLLRDDGEADARSSTAQAELSTLLGHMSVYFPFAEGKLAVQDSKTEQMMQTLNLIYCELFSLMSLASIEKTDSSSGPPSSKRRGPGHTSSGKRRKLANGVSTQSTGIAKQSQHVKEYVLRCLRGETKSISFPMGQPLTPAMYAALLPTLWWLLNNAQEHVGSTGETDADANDVLKAVLEHAMRTGSASGAKRAATEFVADLVLLQDEPSYLGNLRFARGSADHSAVREWLLHLPKTIWELGDKNPSTTELILLFLLRLFQRRFWRSDREVINSLRARLAPFFTIQHPSKGQLNGPFAKLPASLPTSSLKRLALDVAAVLLSVSPCSADGDSVEAAATELRASVNRVASNPEERSYWQEISCVS